MKTMLSILLWNVFLRMDTFHRMGWVDHIRERGNEANHEITIMSADDAQSLIQFTEMLLKLVFEFPKKMPVKLKLS